MKKLKKFVRRTCSAVKRGAVYAVPVIGAASPALADGLDVSTVTVDTAPIFAAALIVLGGIAAIWAVKRVISLFKG